MGAQHTPGPWGFRFVPEGAEEAAGAADPTGIFIGQFSDDGEGPYMPSFLEGAFVDGSHDNMLANAQLIAAAPELLDALQAAPGLPSTFDQYDRFTSEYREFREKRRAAIAKATGND